MDEELKIDDARAISKLKRTPNGKAISWDTYQEFIVAILIKNNGYMLENELNSSLQKHFMAALGDDDVETDGKGCPRWRHFIATAKAVLNRQGIAVKMKHRRTKRIYRVLPHECPQEFMEQLISAKKPPIPKWKRTYRNQPNAPKPRKIKAVF